MGIGGLAEQTEALAQFRADSSLVVADDIQTAAARGAIGGEGAYQKKSAGGQAVFQDLDVFRAVCRLGQKMKYCAVMP